MVGLTSAEFTRRLVIAVTSTMTVCQAAFAKSASCNLLKAFLDGDEAVAVHDEVAASAQLTSHS